MNAMCVSNLYVCLVDKCHCLPCVCVNAELEILFAVCVCMCFCPIFMFVTVLCDAMVSLYVMCVFDMSCLCVCYLSMLILS